MAASIQAQYFNGKFKGVKPATNVAKVVIIVTLKLATGTFKQYLYLALRFCMCEVP